MRCKRCGYDLRDLGEHRCPECGRPFDPQRPTTWLSKPVSGRKSLLLAIIGAVLFIYPLALGAAEDFGVFPSHSLSALRIALMLLGSGLMVTAMAVEMTVLGTGTLVLLNRRPWVTDRKMFYASVPISLAILGYFFGTVIVNVFS